MSPSKNPRYFKFYSDTNRTVIFLISKLNANPPSSGSRNTCREKFKEKAIGIIFLKSLKSIMLMIEITPTLTQISMEQRVKCLLGGFTLTRIDQENQQKVQLEEEKGIESE